MSRRATGTADDSDAMAALAGLADDDDEPAPSPSAAARRANAPPPSSPGGGSRVRELESELADTRARYDNMIKKLKLERENDLQRKRDQDDRIDELQAQLDEAKTAAGQARLAIEREAKVKAERLLEQIRTQQAESSAQIDALTAEIQAKDQALALAQANASKAAAVSRSKATGELSEVRVGLNAEIAELQTRLAEMSDHVAAIERERAVDKERITREADLAARTKYQSISQSFEEQFLAEQEARLRQQEDLLAERERSLESRERDMLESFRTQRAETDTLIARKVHDVQRQLVEQQQRVEAEMAQRDADREGELNKAKADLQRLAESKMVEYEGKAEALRTDKAAFEANIRSKYEAAREADEARLQERRAQLESYAKELEDRLAAKTEALRQRAANDSAALTARETALAEKHEAWSAELVEQRQAMQAEALAKTRALQDAAAAASKAENDRLLAREVELNAAIDALRAKLLAEHQASQLAAAEAEAVREAEAAQHLLELQTAYDKQMADMAGRERALHEALKKTRTAIADDLTKAEAARRADEAAAMDRMAMLMAEHAADVAAAETERKRRDAEAADSAKRTLLELKARERGIDNVIAAKAAEVQAEADAELAAKTADLEERMARRESALADKAKSIAAKADARMAADQKALAEQSAALGDRELELQDKFNAMVSAFNEQARNDARAREAKHAQMIEAATVAELRRQQESAAAQAAQQKELDGVLDALREQLTAAAERQTELAGEIARLHAAIEREKARAEERSNAAAITAELEVSRVRDEAAAAVAAKEKELVLATAAMDSLRRETKVEIERQRGLIEASLRRGLEVEKTAFETQVAEALEDARGKQNAVLDEREAGIAVKERAMLARVGDERAALEAATHKLRDALEVEYAARNETLLAGFAERKRKLEEELSAMRATAQAALDASRAKSDAEIDAARTALEARELALRTRRDDLAQEIAERLRAAENEKTAFRDTVLARLEAERLADTKALGEAKAKLDAREAEMLAADAARRAATAAREVELEAQFQDLSSAVAEKLAVARKADETELARVRSTLREQERALEARRVALEDAAKTAAAEVEAKATATRRAMAEELAEERARDRTAADEAARALEKYETDLNARTERLQKEAKELKSRAERERAETQRRLDAEHADRMVKIEEEKRAFETELQTAQDTFRRELLAGQEARDRDFEVKRKDLAAREQAFMLKLQEERAALERKAAEDRRVLQTEFDARNAEADSAIAARRRELDETLEAMRVKMAEAARAVEAKLEKAEMERIKREKLEAEDRAVFERDMRARYDALERSMLDRADAQVAEAKRKVAKAEEEIAAKRAALAEEAAAAERAAAERASEIEREKQRYEAELHAEFKRKCLDLEARERASLVARGEFEKKCRADADAALEAGRRKLDEATVELDARERAIESAMATRERELQSRLEAGEAKILDKYRDKLNEVKAYATERETALAGRQQAFMAEHEAIKAKDNEKLLRRRAELEAYEAGMRSALQKDMDAMNARAEADAAARSKWMDEQSISRREFEIKAAADRSQRDAALRELFESLGHDFESKVAAAEAELRKRSVALEAAAVEARRAIVEERREMAAAHAAFEKETREAAARAREVDEAEAAAKRAELEAAEKQLYRDFMKRAEEHKKTVYREAREYLEQCRRDLEIATAAELAKAEEIMRERMAYEAEVQAALHECRKEIATRDQRIAILETERQAAAARAIAVLQQHKRELQELEAADAKSRSDLKAQFTRELTERQAEIKRLMDEVSLMERESKLLLEKTRGIVETELSAKFEAIQRNQENQLLAIADENRRRAREEAIAERGVWEKTLHDHYSSIINEAEKRWQSEFDGLVLSEKESMREMRELMARQAQANVQKLLDEWRDAEERAARDRLAFEADIQARYEKVMAEHQKRIAKLEGEKEQLEVAKWQALDEAAAERDAYTTEMRQKFEAVAEEQRKAFTVARHDLEAHFSAEMASRDERMMEAARKQQSDRQAYEVAMREKFESLMDKQMEDMRSIEAKALQAEMVAMEQRAAHENERIRMLQEMEEKAETEARTRYSVLMADLEQTWRQEAAAREVKIEARLTQHYGELLRAKQEHLDLALSISEGIDSGERQRWAAALDELRQKHMSSMASYEEKVRLKYDAMMAQFDNVYHKTLRDVEAQRAADSAKAADAVRDSAVTVRRYKIAFAKWRYDYQAEQGAKYEAVIAELQGRYLQEVENRAREAADRKETDAMGSLLREQNSMAGARALSASLSGREAAASNAAARQGEMAELKAALNKLWAAAETDQAEINVFMKRVADASPDADAMAALYRNEHAKLQALLPLVQGAARRDFLRFRIDSIRRFATDATSTPMSPDRMQRQVVERDQLWSELRGLNERLLVEGAEWEGLYRQQLLYRGAPLLSRMREEAMAEDRPVRGGATATPVSVAASGRYQSPYVAKARGLTVDALTSTPSRV